MKLLRWAPARAFTLIEVLVVITVIAILAALLIPVIEMIRDQARATVTAGRMDEATRALTTIVVADGETPGFVLHRRLQEYQPTVVRGVLTYRRNLVTSEWSPAPTLSENDPPSTMQEWITPPYRRYEFPHPWGSIPTDAPGDVMTELTPTGTVLPIENHSLGDLTPVLSAELLRISGSLDARFSTDAAAWTAYRTDRRRSAPWNDAWGRPLMLSFALFHPRKFTHPPLKEWIHFTPEDQFVRSARVAYGYSRSLYVAGAGVGPRLPDAVVPASITQEASDWTTPDTGLLAQLWAQSIAVAGSASGVELWRTDGTVTPPINAFAKPPWAGVRRAHVNGRYCLVAAPVEIR